LGGCPTDVAEPLGLMVAPLAAHVAEELWGKLGHNESIAHEPFPVADPAMLVEENVEYPVQVNGKVRSHITVPAGLDTAGVEAAALADAKVIAVLAGQAPKKVNIVV
jgi:leucyl-tRNA synthetase